jgi:hypothetical protein
MDNGLWDKHWPETCKGPVHASTPRLLLANNWMCPAIARFVGGVINHDGVMIHTGGMGAQPECDRCSQQLRCLSVDNWVGRFMIYTDGAC